MLLAENKYKNLKQSGKWGNLSDEEMEIVALNAKIEVLKHKGTKKLEGKPKKEEKKQQDEGKKDNKRKQEKKKADFHWQKPRPNQTKRTVKEKEYYWCPNHQNKVTKEWGQWVCHKPIYCKNKENNKPSEEKAPTMTLQPNANLATFDKIDSDTE